MIRVFISHLWFHSLPILKEITEASSESLNFVPIIAGTMMTNSLVLSSFHYRRQGMAVLHC